MTEVVKKKRGAKSKLTPETVEKIAASIRAGNYAKVACASAGISESVYYKWLDEAKAPGASKELLEFMELVERAEAEAEAIKVAQVAKAATKTWQAAAWFLERKHGERWGRNDKLRQEISGPDGGPIPFSVEDARRAIIAALDEGAKDVAITAGADSDSLEG